MRRDDTPALQYAPWLPSMTHNDPFSHLPCWFSVGLVMLLAGSANLVYRVALSSVRGLICLAIAACALTCVWLLGYDTALVVRSAGLMGLALVPCLLLDSTRLTDLSVTLFHVLRRPLIRWGVVSVLGVGMLIGSLVAFERDDRERLDEAHDLDSMAFPSPLRATARGHAVTDRGHVVVLQEPIEPRSPDALTPTEEHVLRRFALQGQVVRHEGATNATNCHGWVFTGGRFWLLGTEVETILTDNAYAPVEHPRPGDLAIFRDQRGVNHTSVVRYVTEGWPVLVEGKWGSSGVYLHATDKSCYGTNVTYYRSPRCGHLLTGLADPANPTVRHSTIGE